MNKTEEKTTTAPDDGIEAGPETQLNDQALDAAMALRELVVDEPEDVIEAGLMMATAQSVATALQDAVDHLRRLEMINEAATARFVADAAAGQAPDAKAVESSQSTTSTAISGAMERLKTLVALSASLQAAERIQDKS